MTTEFARDNTRICESMTSSETAKLAAVPPDDELDINRRLDSLKDLEDGWADGIQHPSNFGNGFGTAPSHEGLEWLKRQFATHYPSGLNRPRLYPTPEGGVQAEWFTESHDADLDINLENRVGEWHNLNLDTNAAYEKTLDLSDPDGWAWLVSELHQLTARES